MNAVLDNSICVVTPSYASSGQMQMSMYTCEFVGQLVSRLIDGLRDLTNLFECTDIFDFLRSEIVNRSHHSRWTGEQEKTGKLTTLKNDQTFNIDSCKFARDACIYRILTVFFGTSTISSRFGTCSPSIFKTRKRSAIRLASVIATWPTILPSNITT